MFAKLVSRNATCPSELIDSAIEAHCDRTDNDWLGDEFLCRSHISYQLYVTSLFYQSSFSYRRLVGKWRAIDTSDSFRQRGPLWRKDNIPNDDGTLTAKLSSFLTKTKQDDDTFDISVWALEMELVQGHGWHRQELEDIYIWSVALPAERLLQLLSSHWNNHARCKQKWVQGLIDCWSYFHWSFSKREDDL